MEKTFIHVSGLAYKMMDKTTKHDYDSIFVYNIHVSILESKKHPWICNTAGIFTIVNKRRKRETGLRQVIKK